MSDMSPAFPPQRGGAAVGFLADLPAVEQGAVLFLRQWCGGPKARARIGQDFTLAFGPVRGAVLAFAQDRLMQLVLGQARRPLMRHADGCACLGGDEAAFAQLVASAAAGQADDAAMIALTLMSGPCVAETVELAEELGLAYADLFSPLARAYGHRPLNRNH
jgi:alkanesulfonate monooxygenase SsuD/methylene tetrahydromethanopterin reductase-like flavin-dependent oxidoreductase (luciferase family)